MITNNHSWSLGSTPNKSPETRAFYSDSLTRVTCCPRDFSYRATSYVCVVTHRSSVCAPPRRGESLPAIHKILWMHPQPISSIFIPNNLLTKDMQRKYEKRSQHLHPQTKDGVKDRNRRNVSQHLHPHACNVIECQRQKPKSGKIFGSPLPRFLKASPSIPCGAEVQPSDNPFHRKNRFSPQP